MPIFAYTSIPVILLQYMFGMGIGNIAEKGYIKYVNSMGVIGINLLLMCYFNMSVIAKTSITTVAAGLTVLYLYFRDETLNKEKIDIFHRTGKASGFISYAFTWSLCCFKVQSTNPIT